MTSTSEPTRAALGEQPDFRKKWAPPLRKRGKRMKIHLMSSKNITYCGKHMIPDPRRIMDFNDWCPLDHIDDVCPKCLEWFNTIRPGQYGKKKALAKS